MPEPKKSSNFFWTCSKRSRKSRGYGFAAHAGLLANRHGESRFGRLGIPLRFWLFGTRSNFRPVNPGDFRGPARTVYIWGENMKYVRPSIGQASAYPIAVRQRQCEYIDAG